MKIYAVQVNPECQESPIFDHDYFPNGIAVCGNGDYMEHMPKVFERTLSALNAGDISEAVAHFNEWRRWYKNITDVFMDLLPPEHKAKYSTREIKLLKSLFLKFPECSSFEENGILCNVLSVVTGKKWDWKTIRGCSQSEWNKIFYPVAEWDAKALRAFECEYFNNGSEWVVDDSESFNPETDNPGEIDGFHMYCTNWGDCDIRAEIAQAAGCLPDDVELFKFQGYRKTPIYGRA